MRRYVFADESGCFTFRRGPNISRYFILCTVQIDDPAPICHDITELRRELAWHGHRQDDCIHATTDPQAVRDAVYEILSRHDFRIDATLLEKSKAQPQARPNEVRFYQYAWYYHFKYVARQLFRNDDEAFICASSIGTKKKRAAFNAAIHDVVNQAIPHLEWRAIFWPNISDPCLLVADYCAWAIQRKWESNDERSYVLVKNKIATECDLWRSGTHHYY